jgi:hypothetical protein
MEASMLTNFLLAFIAVWLVFSSYMEKPPPDWLGEHELMVMIAMCIALIIAAIIATLPTVLHWLIEKALPLLIGLFPVNVAELNISPVGRRARLDRDVKAVMSTKNRAGGHGERSLPGALR